MESDLERRVKALRFSTQGMEDHGSFIVVEGDIRLEKAILLGQPPSAGTPGLAVPNRPLYQYSTNALVSQGYVSQIVVDLTGVNGVSNWASAARNAMADHNSAGSAVYMIEGSPGDITFSAVQSLGGTAIARASFPFEASTSGKPGPTITVSQASDTLTLGQKEKVLVHELGHTIGLRHDNAPVVDQGGAGQAGANLVPGTNQIDSYSVMVGFFDGAPWSGFSQYDLVALRTLYPFVTISGPSNMGPGNTCYYTATGNGGVAPYVYTWSWTTSGGGTAGGYSPSNGNFTLAAQTYTNYTIHLTVVGTDANGRSGPATKAVSVRTTNGGCS
jgi:hypothetical protein